VSLHNLYRDSGLSEEEGFRHIFKSREETISNLKRNRKCDILVVGGGIHGAAFAHIARFNGLDAVLLEKFDYASQTSGRNSKMIHGGLRYLEMFDFQQVLEGIKAREDLFETAFHMVQPYDFYIPISKGDWFFKLKLRLGLIFYDLLVRNQARKHRWVTAGELDQSGMPDLGFKIEGCFRYVDGIMNDARLVLDNLIAARQEGAHCLNYAEVQSFMLNKSGGVTIGWRDTLTGEKHELLAGIVVNCAGPWVPEVGRLTPGPLSSRLKYSQGTHLIFNKHWNGPALFLPLDEKTRYYFVWPHPAGTMVGTTEREVDHADFNPLPFRDEVDEILDRLEKDLPGSGLDRSNLHYSFAGTRTLPLRGRGKNVSRLSRKHVWHYSNGVLSLLGGKYTTATWTAYEGLRKVFKIAGIQNRCVPLSGRKLPGAGLYNDSIVDFRNECLKHGVPDRIVEETISRLGSKVRFLIKQEGFFSVLSDSLLRGEVELAIDIDQAETLEDIMCRRLGLEYLPDHGFNVMPEILKILGEKKPGLDLKKEEENYRNKISVLNELMGIG
jgi:glycerol-3-phosphate dehydrogenase